MNMGRTKENMMMRTERDEEEEEDTETGNQSVVASVWHYRAEFKNSSPAPCLQHGCHGYLTTGAINSLSAPDLERLSGSTPDGQTDGQTGRKRGRRQRNQSRGRGWGLCFGAGLSEEEEGQDLTLERTISSSWGRNWEWVGSGWCVCLCRVRGGVLCHTHTRF